MSLGDGSVWDENNPQQSTIVNQGPLYETDFKVGVRSRMANEHIWPSSQTGTGQAGQHTVVSLQAQTATPFLPVVNATTQAGVLFASSGVGLLYASTGGVVLSIPMVTASPTTSGMLLVSTATGNGAAGWTSFPISIASYGFNLAASTPVAFPTFKIAYGMVSGPINSAVITGLGFANATSYFVNVISITNDNTTASAIYTNTVVLNDGAHFTIYPFKGAPNLMWQAMGI